jgi:hypothetical protein
VGQEGDSVVVDVGAACDLTVDGLEVLDSCFGSDCPADSEIDAIIEISPGSGELVRLSRESRNHELVPKHSAIVIPSDGNAAPNQRSGEASVHECALVG